MELLSLLFSIIFITTSISKKSFSIETNNTDDHSLSTPTHYSIQLNVDVENNAFHGTSNMSVTLYKQTGEIYLNTRNLDIHFPLLINNITIHERTKSLNEYFYFNKTTHNLRIFYFGLSPGNYTLRMEFEGHIDDMSNFAGGFFKSPYINEKGDREWFVATHNRDTGIRGTFPCRDVPESKAKFKIIVQHHRNYTVLSNMPKSIETDVVSNDIVRTHLIETPVIPAHLITIVLCNLPLTIVSKNIILRGKQQFEYDLTFASDVIVNVTHYFQDEWKYSNIFPTEQHFAIPGFVDDGLAKLGFVFYRNEDIIYNEKVHPIARKMEVAYLIGRKIGREWLSSMTRPRPQFYFWLHEGITTVLFALDVIDKIIPNSGVSDLFVSQILQESLYLEDQGVMNSLISEDSLMFSDINSIISFSYYIKAPAILRMLQYIVSYKVFRRGIDTYFNNVMNLFKGLSASLNNFLTVMQYTYDQANLPPRNIKEIMDSWIRQKHYPILQVKRYQNRNGFHTKIKGIGTWWLPIPYTNSSYIDYSSVYHPHLFKMNETIVRRYTPSHKKSEEDDWILFNLQRVGYYRVNYTIGIWQGIIRYLNSENYTNIHVLDRAQLIDNVFYFTFTGKLNASIFLELTKYLSRETEYVAWYPMIKAIERISYIFPFENESKYIKTFILQQLEPLLETIGYDENPNDTYVVKCLRQEAVKWACILNLYRCKLQAFRKLYLHLTQPEVHKLLPGWKEWTYCNGLTLAVQSTFRSVHNIYLNQTLLKKNRITTELMTCYKYGYFFKETKYNAIDEVIYFHNTVAKHAKDDLILDYILSEWTNKPKEINTIAAFIDIINHVYSKEQLNKVMNFARKEIRSKAELFINSSNLESVNPIISNKIHKFMRNVIEQQISDIQDKINTRLSQIENQINAFVSVFRI